MEPRYSSAVTVRKLDPAEMMAAPPPKRCVRCGKVIVGKPVETSIGFWHDECRPAPAPEVVQLLEVAARRRQTRDLGPRTTHLGSRDRERILAWLAEHGPATARMVGWALDLPFREVSLLLHSLDGERVEVAGVLVTGQRGRPPVLWCVREAVAA